MKTKSMRPVTKQKVENGFHELFNDVNPNNLKLVMLLWMYNMYLLVLLQNRMHFCIINSRGCCQIQKLFSEKLKLV